MYVRAGRHAFAWPYAGVHQHLIISTEQYKSKRILLVIIHYQNLQNKNSQTKNEVAYLFWTAANSSFDLQNFNDIEFGYE